jgi:hypothetical protein
MKFGSDDSVAELWTILTGLLTSQLISQTEHTTHPLQNQPVNAVEGNDYSV